ncbi:mechanosensitive ion channel [Curvibacter sp. HBC61]|uniref:Small-conductance mechanosensitive channel n=1 Tax=Curvibacter cyanobacteriorum TaxID=3026422 RepID=A0ABT5N3F6_9BURK|nr:mechanosensitive ion channel domain-containing protein [Curvibacter sp. HBC61]MDD0839588.1 mechanosensitive ion channel [Curvibacter sp. HBC61]
MWPLITLALAALAWLLQVTLSSEPGFSLWAAHGQWLTPLALGLSALAVAQVLQRLLVSLLRGTLRYRSGAGSELLQSVLTILLYALVAVVFLHWGLGRDLGSLLATSALLSAIIGLALQPTLGHLFAGVSIEIDKPIKVGDFIRRDDLEGQVVAMTWRSVKVRTVRGSTLVMPNSEFTNRSLEVIAAEVPFRHEFPFFVSTEHPPGQVVRTAMQVLQSGLPGTLEQPGPSVLLVSNDPANGTLRYVARFYTLRYMERAGMVSAFLERFWYALSREGVSLPAPPAFWPVWEGAPGLWSAGAGGGAGVAPLVAVGPGGAADLPTGRPLLRPSGVAAGGAATPQLASVLPGLEAALNGLSPALRQALQRQAQTLRYGRHERCEGPSLRLLVAGRLRETRPLAEAEASGDLALLLAALADPAAVPGPSRRLEHEVYQALVAQARQVLGPVAPSLCEPIAALTEDPWLAWQALAQAIPEPEARARFLQHAPPHSNRVLHPGAWVGWAHALGLEPSARECRVSQGCTVLVWSADTLRALLRQASGQDQAALLQHLRRQATGCAGLTATHWLAWLRDEDTLRVA